jgi:energy-coupling factor transporter transmembrane protein EcfT
MKFLTPHRFSNFWVMVLVLVFSLKISAQSIWLNTTNGAWGIATNWSPAVVPNASDAVVIFGNRPPDVNTTNIVSGLTNTPFVFGMLISSNGMVLNGSVGPRKTI